MSEHFYGNRSKAICPFRVVFSIDHRYVRDKAENLGIPAAHLIKQRILGYNLPCALRLAPNPNLLQGFSMPRQSTNSKFRPFENLNKLLKKARRRNPRPQIDRSDSNVGSSEQRMDDVALFQQAMVGVTKLPKSRQIEKRTTSSRNLGPTTNPDQEAYCQLKHLVETGQGFRVSQTAEYVEGSGEPINPAILARLHQGDFAIQDFIDLHGLSLEEAMEQMDAFIKYALTRRRKAILIVHGRGLSSPAEPVLKTAVIKRINSGPWRKWIVAYASARLCDGGAGATYVLLRDYPKGKSNSKLRSNPPI